ncbi:MAG: hypothetical protein NC416_02865 [Eubacterium sp.]|nr:hypothetical protein [Eubacterium sp.]
MGIKIRFAEESRPVIQRGLHKISLNQTTNIRENGNNISGNEEIYLMMTRRRFSMDSEEVYSCYPPAGAEGDLSCCLPHVVFMKSTLPWEYEGDQGSPGLALFVCTKEEGVMEQTMKTGDVFRNREASVFCSEFLKISESDAEDGSENCRIVDVPASLFRDLRTDPQERRLLTHVREVKLDDKVTDPTVKDGVFSCLVSNRYPMESANDSDPISHHAYVVSLREYDHTDIPQNAAYVRLICLYSWEFTTKKRACDFRAVMQKIRPGVFLQPIPETVQDPELRGILRRGFLPMNHDLRNGGKTVSWYRGPWLPMDEIQEKPRYRIFSDQYYFYDPDQGMMDVSYACAWQLGRMIAMNHATVAKELIAWRLQNCYEAAKDNQRRQLKDHLPGEDEVFFKQMLVDTCAMLTEEAIRNGQEKDHESMDEGTAEP